ncbi:hypothetical protein BGX30_010722 [Mortierella sp. GBA39]|nr:hypothetical protein BGX30_010722 [Mortierella sp. GBA39]
MSYDNNNNNDNNNKRHDHENDRYGGDRDEPNSNGQMQYKHKNRGNTFDSNGLYNRERGLYNRIAYYRDPSSGSRHSWNNDRFPSDSNRASYDGRCDSYSRDRYNKNRDRSSADSKKYDDSDYRRYDRRERYGNNRNRHDNSSRSPTRDRDTGRRRGSRESGMDRDTERSEDADRDTASPPRRNIRTDFIIYQGGLLYSDRKAHDLPPHHHSPVSGHHAATYIKREGTSLRTVLLIHPRNAFSPVVHESVASSPVCHIDIECMAAATQDGVTDHVQKLQMATYPAVVQDHRQFQEVQPQAPPQDRRSELVSAAAVAYKALQGVLNDYERQTGNSTAGISVATILGKRSVGRPSKVRLENEYTAHLGIKRAKSEMKELEQVPKQLNGVVGQAKIASTPRRTDIDKADTLGHTAHLSITSAVTMNTVCHRQNPM